MVGAGKASACFAVVRIVLTLDNATIIVMNLQNFDLFKLDILDNTLTFGWKKGEVHYLNRYLAISIFSQMSIVDRKK